MPTKTRRYTLQEMKNRSTGHFFDRDTMKFFRDFAKGPYKVKYGSRYDSETGQNYIVVTDPWGKRHFHKFRVETGNITPVNVEDIPPKIKEK